MKTLNAGPGPSISDDAAQTTTPGASSATAFVPHDLLTVLVLTLVAAGLTLLEAPASVRLPLGVMLVLFLPGYALVSVLFPGTDGPDGVARIALSVALSLATIPPLALAIDRSPWRIAQTTVTCGLVIVTLVALAIAGILRARLPANERYGLRITTGRIPPPRSWTTAHWGVASVFALASLLFVIGGYDVVKTRLIGVPLTEFALYNATGEAQDYPRTITVGEPTDVRISITNQENQRITYQLVIAGAGVAVASPPARTLADGETWQGLVQFTVTSTGSDLPVRFELYRLDQPANSAPYRLLQLIVDGQAAESH